MRRVIKKRGWLAVHSRGRVCALNRTLAVPGAVHAVHQASSSAVASAPCLSQLQRRCACCARERMPQAQAGNTPHATPKPPPTPLSSCVMAWRSSSSITMRLWQRQSPGLKMCVSRSPERLLHHPQHIPPPKKNTHTHPQTHKHTDTQTDTHPHTHRHTDTQTHTQTGRHTDTHTPAALPAAPSPVPARRG